MKKFTPDKIIIIITVISAAMLQLIDTSIVNVALTQMMGNLGASFEDIGWVITAYGISNVIMITLSGWMSARFGRKFYFAASIAVFTIGSILCGLSNSVWQLVLFRFIQGLGGGGLLSTAQAILIETFPKEDLGMATAIFGIGVIVGPTIGPTLGGYITDNYSWQWIFFINIPFGIAATILTMLYLKEPKEKAQIGKMDWLAFGLLVIFICALQIVLEKGQSEDWFEARYITVLAVVATLGGIFFVWRELVVKQPIVNLRLFRNGSFSTGTLFNLVLGLGLYGSNLLVPIYCQSLLGLSAMDTGLLMLPGSIATAIMMPIIGSLLRRNLFHPAIYSAMGLVLFFFSCMQLRGLTTQAGPGDFFIPLMLRGFAMGMIFTPLTTLSLATLKGVEIPQGTSLSNMIRQLGGAIGVAFITTFITIRSAQHYANLSEYVSIYSTPAQQRIALLTNAFLAKGYDAQHASQSAYAILNGGIMQQAAALTYRDLFAFIGLFFIIIMPLLLFFRRTKKKTDHEELLTEIVE
jgi:DHA2 family multidrug resistance protein